VCKTEIEDKNFYEGPILLIVIIFNEENLEFLYFLNALWQFGNNEESEKLHES